MATFPQINDPDHQRLSKTLTLKLIIKESPPQYVICTSLPTAQVTFSRLATTAIHRSDSGSAKICCTSSELPVLSATSDVGIDRLCVSVNRFVRGFSCGGNDYLTLLKPRITGNFSLGDLSECMAVWGGTGGEVNWGELGPFTESVYILQP